VSGRSQSREDVAAINSDDRSLHPAMTTNEKFSKVFGVVIFALAEAADDDLRPNAITIRNDAAQAGTVTTTMLVALSRPAVVQSSGQTPEMHICESSVAKAVATNRSNGAGD
jgi:hypothetical protein